MATFCDISGCSNLSFRTDKNTRKHYCSNHWRQYSTDIDKRSITAKALAKGKPTRKPTKAGWFDVQNAFSDQISPENKTTPQTPTEQDIIETIPVSDLNSRIDWVSPSPESFDGEKTGRYIMDEVGATGCCGIDESLVNLSTDLDMVLSLYIRHKYADKNGMVKCFTCPVILPIKEIQNGHYVKRSNRATRFLELNCRPQCPTCNQDHNYDEMPYTNALEREQKGLAEQLKELGKETYKATRSELKTLLIEYRSKLAVLKTKIQTK